MLSLSFDPAPLFDPHTVDQLKDWMRAAAAAATAGAIWQTMRRFARDVAATLLAELVVVVLTDFIVYSVSLAAWYLVRALRLLVGAVLIFGLGVGLPAGLGFAAFAIVRALVADDGYEVVAAIAVVEIYVPALIVAARLCSRIWARAKMPPLEKPRRPPLTLGRMLRMSPRDFELFVLDWLADYRGLRRLRHQGRPGDGGIDLVGHGVGVSVKRYRLRPVGEPELRDLVGALTAKKLRKGIVVCSSRFSAAAIEYAQQINQQGKIELTLIDGRQLLRQTEASRAFCPSRSSKRFTEARAVS